MPKTKRAPLPFNQRLGSSALQRVRKPFARKAWALGLPIWLDAEKGAILLRRPVCIPCRDKKSEFEEACLKAFAGDKPVPQTMPKDAIWLAPYGPVCLHFMFDDGSNPFVKYGTVQELVCELESWSVRWLLKPIQSETADTHVSHFSLMEKNPAPKGLFTKCP